MSSPEIAPSSLPAADSADRAGEIREAAQHMIQEERQTLGEKFRNASGKVRALMSVFILSTALSGDALHVPEPEKPKPSKNETTPPSAEPEVLPKISSSEEIDPDGSEALRILKSLPKEIQRENERGASLFVKQIPALPEGAQLIEAKDNAEIYFLGSGEKLGERYAVVDERFNQTIVFESQSAVHASVWGREFVAFNPSTYRAFNKAMGRELRLAEQGFLEPGAYKDSKLRKSDKEKP